MALERMGRIVLSARVLSISLLWLLFGLLANTPALSIKPNGANAILPSLLLSAHGNRKASPSGSFLSMRARPRSASFTFGLRGDAGTLEVPPQEERRRSLSFEPRKGTPSGAWSRDGQTPNLVQPQGQQQTQQQQDQQQPRRHSRLGRLRRALRRVGGAAKEKLRSLWKRIRRGASRAKRAARRVAVGVYQRLPRFRKNRPSEEVATATGMAGAGLAAAGGAQSPGEGALERRETLEKGEVTSPVSPAVSTASTATEETAEQPLQAEAEAPTSEGLELEGSEEWHEARAPEEAEESIEEWHDTVTPEQMESVLARAREMEESKKTEKERQPEEAEELGLSPQCLRFFPRMTTTMKRLNKEWRGHCMFWTLFMRNGNFGTFVDELQDLAAQTLAKIKEAEQLEETEQSAEALMLRSTLVLALAEEALAKAEDDTDVNCWFLEPENLFQKANSKEEKVLLELNPVTFFKNPLEFTQHLTRLIDVVYGDTAKCLASTQAEITTREDLQQVLLSEKQKLEAAMEQPSPPLSNQQMRDMQQIVEELGKLHAREFCSVEQVHLLATQGKNIRSFIADYQANGANWWRAQWPVKLHACRRLSKGNAAVPKNVAQSCRKYESSKPPRSRRDVSDFLLWMWDAGSFRKGE